MLKWMRTEQPWIFLSEDLQCTSGNLSGTSLCSLLENFRIVVVSREAVINGK